MKKDDGGKGSTKKVKENPISQILAGLVSGVLVAGKYIELYTYL